MTLRFPAVLALMLAMGCPSVSPPWSRGDDDDDDNDSNGSSSGMVAPGQPIPLEKLCPTLANGYFRYSTYAITGMGEWASNATCPVAISDDVLQEYIFGDMAKRREESCGSSDGGMIGLVGQLADSERAGRITWNAAAAGKCVEGGRNFIQGKGGLPYWWTGEMTSDYMDTWTNHCNKAIIGHQAAGEPCMHDWECDQSGEGATCISRGTEANTCEGRCVALAAEGQECETHGRPDCQPELVCIKPGDRSKGICVDETAPSGGECWLDGGRIECQQSETCVEGVCQARFAEGEECSESEECAEGLHCAGTPRRCLPPLVQGTVCGEGLPPCATCLICHQPKGADDARCLPLASENQDCSAAMCRIGLACVDNRCVPAARTGQSCKLDEDDPTHSGDEMKGTCLLADDACVNGTCRKRDESGSACVVAPFLAGSSVRGSCKSEDDVCVVNGNGTIGTCLEEGSAGTPCEVEEPTFHADDGDCHSSLTCARANPDDAKGTCVAEPSLGAACGDRQDLSRYCAYLDGGMDAGAIQVTCSTWDDAGVGICLRNRALVDEPCNSQCQEGSVCANRNDAGVGRCILGGPEGGSCGGDAGWGYTCQTGLYCKRLGADAGYTRQCSRQETRGSPCDSLTECATQLRCINDVCADPSPQGGPCGYSHDDCQRGLKCESNVCKPLAAVGEACNYNDQCQTGLFCRGQVCRSRVARGEACESDSECQDGLDCIKHICRTETCDNVEDEDNCDSAGDVTMLLFFGSVVSFPWLRSRRRRK